jgi:NAD+ kinase
VASQCTVLVVLGGDGTLLAGVRALKGRQVPVVGVNLGGLGFLTEITKGEMIGIMNDLAEGKLTVHHRSTIDGKVIRRNKNRSFTVINDAVVSGAELARMIDVNIRINGDQVCSIKADGLIVSTPIGSTAYSLSAGGPIVHPTMRGMTITPICPHTLTNRPLVLPPDSEVEATIGSDKRVRLTLDGQEGMFLYSGDRIVLNTGKNDVLLVSNPKRTYFDILRQKLHWYER